MTTVSRSLGEVFPEEIERCKELQVAYKEIGPAGQFGLAAITDLIKQAEKANKDQDVVAMLRLYPELQQCQ